MLKVECWIEKMLCLHGGNSCANLVVTKVLRIYIGIRHGSPGFRNNPS